MLCVHVTFCACTRCFIPLEIIVTRKNANSHSRALAVANEYENSLAESAFLLSARIKSNKRNVYDDVRSRHNWHVDFAHRVTVAACELHRCSRFRGRHQVEFHLEGFWLRKLVGRNDRHGKSRSVETDRRRRRRPGTRWKQILGRPNRGQPE